MHSFMVLMAGREQESWWLGEGRYLPKKPSALHGFDRSGENKVWWRRKGRYLAKKGGEHSLTLGRQNY